MKTHRIALTLAAAAVFSTGLLAQSNVPDKHESLKQEIELAISRGLTFLKSQQDKTTGSWSKAEEPAISALVLSSFMGDPNRKLTDDAPAEVDKGYQFLLQNVQPDGGIYAKGRATYNTAISLLALSLNPKPEFEQNIIKARKFLIGLQTDLDENGKTDNPFDGGFGYGPPQVGKPGTSDLSNSIFALEALYYSKKVFEDKASPEDKSKELNYSAAIQFISRCQNRTATNDQKWASDDAKNVGGFIYRPGENKAEEDKLPDGRVAMRSYGSISYAGMLSFIYAGLSPEDDRVQAALKWLAANYTLEENPGMGQEGKFYYYHTMAKALSTAGVDEFKTSDGKTVDWRDALGRQLINVQKPDGFWLNDTGRWMENDPVLVTAYTLLALEHIYRSL